MKKIRKSVQTGVVLLLIASMLMALVGFTYQPSYTPEAVVATLTVGENGAVSVSNMTHVRPEWYPTAVQVGGKWGIAACDTWASPLMMLLDQTKFKDVHDIKITVEWFDANHGRENNAEKFYRFLYVDKDTQTRAYSGWLGSYQKTDTWREQTVTLNNVDLTANTIIRNGNSQSIELLPDGMEAALPTGSSQSSYHGLLVHSIKIEAVVSPTYQLKQLGLVDTATYSADGVDSDIEWATSAYKSDTETRTIKDKNGVTMTAKISTKGTDTGGSNSECYFKLDTTKYKDVKRVNVAVTYFDAKDSNNDKAQLKVRWPLRTEGGGTWGGWAKETTGIWIGGSGGTETWKTQIFTLDDCDFSVMNKMSAYTPHNLQLYTGAPSIDMNTTDTSDDFYGMLIAKVEVTPLPEYSFSSLSFTDKDGKAVTTFSAGQPLYTDLTVTRAGGSAAADVTVIVAMYDQETDLLEAISFETINMAVNDTKTFENCFTCPADVSGKEVRVMVWDSMQSLCPISNELIVQ